MSNFKTDLAKEAILAAFLDQQYKASRWKTDRVFDKDLQKLGIDFWLTQGPVQTRVDEKAQLHYLNQALPTFSLEIDYLIGNNNKPGWLFDPEKITDIYAFIFSIFLQPESTGLDCVSAIKSCEIVLVKRLNLLNELAKLGLHLKSCGEQSKLLRTSSTLTKLPYSPNFYFYISRHLAEAPVNLIVQKSFLEKLGRKYVFEAGE